ncbi:MAG: hypothetical protein OXI74_21500 [Rhodospirillaceae bacterium]|nr:hypothetical protein [Rhodospirillaceae bacterium]
MTRYANLKGDTEVDVTDLVNATGSHVVMIQHTAESGRGASSVRWELRPDSALTDRLGPGYLLEPADGPVSVPVAADRHLVAWRGRASGEPVQLAVSVTSTS